MSDAEQFFGPYRVIRTLARGGMAEIFLAKKEGPAGFSKSVVVKRILKEHSGNEEFVQMFRDEARLAAQLDHPNIVHITDFGEVQGSYFLAMEYLQGSDLGSLLRARQKGGQGPFPATIAAFIGSFACAGLHYAHTSIGEDGRPLRIVHRDISPNNLFLTFQGAVKVLDFGIAKAEGKLVQTRAGMVKGKLLYMSPEQTWGKVLDARSDVWALGVVLYELLTDKRPFFRSGEADEKQMNERLTMEAIDREQLPPPSSVMPGVPPALDAIVLRCVEKSPGARWQSAADLQRALEAFVSSQGGATASMLAQVIESTVGAEQIKAATQQTPLARQASVDPEVDVVTKHESPAGVDPEAAVVTQFKAAASDATAIGPGAAESTALDVLGGAPAGPLVRRRGPGLALVLSVLVLAVGIIAWKLSQPADEGLIAPVVPPVVQGRLDAGSVVAALEPPSSTDAGVVAAAETPLPVDAGELAVMEAPIDAGAAAVAKPMRVEKSPRRVPPPLKEVVTPKQVGRLTVNCSPYGTVLIDDAEVGRASPELSLALPVGPHRVRCAHPSFGESTTTVVITADQTIEMRLKY